MTVNLTALRLNRGHSLRNAAQEIGVDRRTLQKAERGDSIHPGCAKLIADHYGLEVLDIVPLEGETYAGPERRRREKAA